MTDIVDLAAFRRSGAVVPFAVPAPRFAVGDRVQRPYGSGRQEAVVTGAGFRNGAYVYALYAQGVYFVVGEDALEPADLAAGDPA